MASLFRGDWIPLFGTGARSKRPSHTDLFQRGLPEFGWRVKGESEMDDRWDHFNRVFHHKPSILGYPCFWKHPFDKGICVEFILDFCFWLFLCLFFFDMLKNRSCFIGVIYFLLFTLPGFCFFLLRPSSRPSSACVHPRGRSNSPTASASPKVVGGKTDFVCAVHKHPTPKKPGGVW